MGLADEIKRNRYKTINRKRRGGVFISPPGLESILRGSEPAEARFNNIANLCFYRALPQPICSHFRFLNMLVNITAPFGFPAVIAGYFFNPGGNGRIISPRVI